MKEIDEQTLNQIIEKREDEGATEYSAFLHFVRLPSDERIGGNPLRTVSETTGLDTTELGYYRTTYAWDKRASMLDAYQLKLDFDERREAMQEDNKRYIATNREIKETTMMNLKKTANLITHLLDYANLIGEEKQTGEVETKDGRIVPTITTVNMKAKVSDIAILTNSLVKAARLINDLPTEIIETKTALPSNLEELDYDQLSAIEEQLAQQRRKIEAAQRIETVQ